MATVADPTVLRLLFGLTRPKPPSKLVVPLLGFLQRHPVMSHTEVRWTEGMRSSWPFLKEIQSVPDQDLNTATVVAVQVSARFLAKVLASHPTPNPGGQEVAHRPKVKE